MESTPYSIFEGYKFIPIRQTFQKVAFEVTTIPFQKDYAIIQTQPTISIEKNFKEDTISIEFVEKFAAFGCSYFSYQNSFIRADFKLRRNILGQKQKIILFRGEPSGNNSFLNNQNQNFDLKNGWKYYINSQEQLKNLNKK